MGADYPGDIGVARELVGQWLLTIPAPERIRAIRAITRTIVGYKTDNPGPDDADAELAQMLMNG